MRFRILVVGFVLLAICDSRVCADQESPTTREQLDAVRTIVPAVARQNLNLLLITDVHLVATTDEHGNTRIDEYRGPADLLPDLVKALQRRRSLKVPGLTSSPSETGNGPVDVSLGPPTPKSRPADVFYTAGIAASGLLAGGLLVWCLSFKSSRGQSRNSTDPHLDRGRRFKITKQFDVFLAHNSADKSDVERIARELGGHQVSYWLDSEQIAPGDWFQDVIQAAIGKVHAAAIFIGRNGLGRWQVLELRSFVSQCIENHIRVIPVLLPGVEQIPDVPNLRFLKELQCVKFRSVDDVRALQQLMFGISRPQTKTDDA